MTVALVKAMEEMGCSPRLLDKQFSRKMSEVEKPSLRKIIRFLRVTVDLLFVSLILRPWACVFFISTYGPALLADAILLYLLRLSRTPYILQFGGKGLHALTSTRSLWKRFAASAIRNSVGGVELGNVLREDVRFLIPSERLIVIPNCLIESTAPNRTRNSRPFTVLFLSNLLPTKGPLELLIAAKMIVEQREDIRFTIAGGIWDKRFHSELTNYIAKENLQSFVRMHEAVDAKFKATLFETSDILVFPTRNEAFGLVILEAMRAGLPVITSSEGAIPEVVVDGLTGFLIDPRNPQEIAARILLLSRDRKLCERMGLAGRERFEEEYTFDKYVDRWKLALDFFKERIDSGGRRKGPIVPFFTR